ncbi:MAG TPA: hypothetical protein VF756_27530 [Thermoanaerobaculia bacterium]
MLSTQVIRGVEDIGPYQVLENLGPAPFGTAYLTVDSRTDQTAIVKAIPPSQPWLLQEPTPWELLLKETESLFRIYHRGIPALLEIAEHDGMLVVAFAPAEGETLHEFLARGGRPDRALLIDWGCQLLEILAEAHAEGILHRHVTEDQIVLSPDGHLVLTGFGLTQIYFDPLTTFPPVHVSTETCTPQDDLYSVGLLLRRLAFASGLKSGGVPGRDPLLKVLARATFPDPATRFQDAAEMADALRSTGRVSGASVRRDSAAPRETAPASISSVRQLPVRFIPDPAPEPSEGSDRRFALMLVAAALLLMLTVIATGWFLIAPASEDASAPRPIPAAPVSSSSSSL